MEALFCLPCLWHFGVSFILKFSSSFSVKVGCDSIIFVELYRAKSANSRHWVRWVLSMFLRSYTSERFPNMRWARCPSINSSIVGLRLLKPHRKYIFTIRCDWLGSVDTLLKLSITIISLYQQLPCLWSSGNGIRMSWRIDGACKVWNQSMNLLDPSFSLFLTLRAISERPIWLLE